MIIKDQFGTIQNLQRPVFSKPVTDQELFFAVSYSKPALVGKKVSKMKQKIDNFLSSFLFLFSKMSRFCKIKKKICIWK